MKSFTRKIGLITVAMSIVLLFRSGFAGADEWDVLNPANPPVERFGHSILCLQDGKVLLYGGEDGQELLNDIAVYENGRWAPVSPINQAPLPRKGHCVWQRNGKVHVHAGKGKAQYFDDLWAYDPETKEWTENAGRPSGYGGRSIEKKFLLFVISIC